MQILFSREETGEDAYDIPVGGSNSVGFFGYIDCIRELQHQVLLTFYQSKLGA